MSSETQVSPAIRATRRVMFTWLPILLAATTAVPGTSSAAPTTEAVPPCRIAVLDLVGRGLKVGEEDSYAALLTEVMTNEIADASQCQVLSQSDIKSMVDFEITKQQCTGDGDTCLTELGQALGVERIVAGSLGHLGSDYLITVRLVDIKNTVVERRAEEVVSGQPEKLRLAAKLVGRALFPRDTPLAPVPTGPAAGEPGPAFMSSPMFWGGVGIGVVGLAGAAVGVGLGVDADGRLGDAQDTDKASALGQGRAGVAIAAVSTLAVVGGGTLLTLGLME